MKNLKIGEKITRVPLIQGGMGVGVSLGRLAGSVAREGGIGIISTAQIGYREPDFDRNPEEANLRAIESEMKKARAISPDGIIGYNVMTALRAHAAHIKAAVKAGADIIISGAGLPTELPALTEGSRTKIAPIVSTDKSAQVILKYWDRKYKRTADLVVIEGPKAGGHLGYSPEDVAQLETEGYDRQVQEILNIVHGYEEKYQQRIPVVFAGGVFDRKDIDHYLSLGCAGVQMATRFVVTEECDADPRYKQAYLNARKEDITIMKSPVGMPGRAIRNSFLKLHEQEPEKITHCYQCLKKCDRASIPYCITTALTRAADGNVEDSLLFCGENAWRLTEMTTVHDLMQELCHD